MRTSTRPIRTFATVAVAAVVLLTGCVSPTTKDDAKLTKHFQTPKWLKAPWSKKDEMPEPYPGPVKMAVTWTPDVLVQQGKTPTRGFGGRLFFFDERSKTVPVEGELTVHGFEANTRTGKETIRPFKFTPDQFTDHFSQSDFGASYSIWIPWDVAGGEQKRISLVPTFKTSAGKLVQGNPTTVILPGPVQEPEPTLASTNYAEQYLSHKDAIRQHTTRPSGLVTTTIRRHKGATVPNRIQDRVGPTITERIEAIAASQAKRADGTTPFIEIPSSPGTPEVMAASAEMPTRTTAPRRMPITRRR